MRAHYNTEGASKMAKSYAAKQRRAKRRNADNPHRIANPAMASAMADLRRSSAACAHDGKSRADRTRGAGNKTAIRESLYS